MVSALLWDARPTGETVIAGTSTLKNLANDGVAVAAADVANGTGLFTHADFLLYIHDFAAAPSAGGYFALYIIYEFNTTYGDGEDGDVANVLATHLSGNQLAGIFPLKASDEDQYIQLMGVPIYAHDFRCVVVNKSGQAVANSDGSTLTIFRYSYEAQ